MENFTRRNFIGKAFKLLTGAAVIGMVPNSAEARIDPRKIGELRETPLSQANTSRNISPFDLPKIPKFQTLDELEIASPHLRFVDSMTLRKYTTAIVVHHAGMTRNEDMSLGAIHQIHLNNGWAGVGYHFVVHKNGVIEHARPIERVGAHAYKHNRYTVGICMTGNFDIGVPSYEQSLATERLVAALCEHYEIAPSYDTIFGHRDLCDTSCPGQNFYLRMPELIKNVDEVLSRV